MNNSNAVPTKHMQMISATPLFIRDKHHTNAHTIKKHMGFYCHVKMIIILYFVHNNGMSGDARLSLNLLSEF